MARSLNSSPTITAVQYLDADYGREATFNITKKKITLTKKKPFTLKRKNTLGVFSPRCHVNIFVVLVIPYVEVLQISTIPQI